jgi:hypothetical protein
LSQRNSFEPLNSTTRLARRYARTKPRAIEGESRSFQPFSAAFHMVSHAATVFPCSANKSLCPLDITGNTARFRYGLVDGERLWLIVGSLLPDGLVDGQRLGPIVGSLLASQYTRSSTIEYVANRRSLRARRRRFFSYNIKKSASRQASQDTHSRTEYVAN